ncbi:hypothetical protein EAI_12446 [Harpegnathos saltator]|uniref:Uncharacterized protein n=1 Tax=Harpegnathos saltator TaxID=610380 RepID=E2BXT5_HARSA|nr:hypothetical protein EAI_12446 [Harpegnathos saltator]
MTLWISATTTGDRAGHRPNVIRDSPRTSTGHEDNTFASNGVRAATVRVEASRRSFCPYDAPPASARINPTTMSPPPPPPLPLPSPAAAAAA